MKATVTSFVQPIYEGWNFNPYPANDDYSRLAI